MLISDLVLETALTTKSFGSKKNAYTASWYSGTATFKGRTVSVRVYANAPAVVWIDGMVGRYRTGGTTWPASVRVNVETDKLFASFGRDDRDPKFRKEDNIFFA